MFLAIIRYVMMHGVSLGAPLSYDEFLALLHVYAFGEAVSGRLAAHVV